MMKRVLAAVLGLLLCVPPPMVTAQAVSGEAELVGGIRQVDEGDFETAILTLDSAVRRLAAENAPKDRIARAHVYRGIAYLGLEQKEKATGAFREALAQVPTLELNASEYSPKVIDAFQAARGGAPRPSPSPATAAPRPAASPAPAKKGGSKTLPILLGVGAAAGVGIAVAAGGGGDGGGSGGGTTPPPSTPTTTVILQNTFIGLASGRANNFDFAIPASGVVNVTVNWTFASNDLDTVLTTPACPSASAAFSGGCTVLGQDRGFAKPSQITANVTAGNARVYIGNFGSSPESGTIQVTLAR